MRWARERFCGKKAHLDGVDPVSTLGRADVPPLLPNFWVSTRSVGGGEQESGDDCDAEDVKESHSRTERPGGETGELKNNPYRRGALL